MAVFINKKLEEIRNELKCGHCGGLFKGSYRQAKSVKYEDKAVYCSDVCRSTFMSKKAREQAVREGKKLRKGVLFGPCKKCGEMFESHIDKQYCSMDCYTKSDQFRELPIKRGGQSLESRKKISQKLRKGSDVPCLECGKEFYQKPPSKNKKAKKFCSKICYRAYLSKRFDRWVANPKRIPLIQCYDEFLDQDEIECIFDDCDWVGKQLTLHINLYHGVEADEFKRAAGFNISTGVIARPLAEAYRDRGLVGVATQPNKFALELAHEAQAKNNTRYTSLECIEHLKKARALMGHGPERVCVGCGVRFQQSTPFGKTLYCSSGCRDSHYSEKRKANKIWA